MSPSVASSLLSSRSAEVECSCYPSRPWPPRTRHWPNYKLSDCHFLCISANLRSTASSFSAALATSTAMSDRLSMPASSRSPTRRGLVSEAMAIPPAASDGTRCIPRKLPAPLGEPLFVVELLCTGTTGTPVCSSSGHFSPNPRVRDCQWRGLTHDCANPSSRGRLSYTTCNICRSSLYALQVRRPAGTRRARFSSCFAVSVRRAMLPATRGQGICFKVRVQLLTSWYKESTSSHLSSSSYD